MQQYSDSGKSIPVVGAPGKATVEAPLEQYLYIGKSIARVDAPDKATGDAVYSCDMNIPGMIIGKCKRSPHPFAKIVSIDISKALKLPGVRAVITTRNVTQSHFGEFVFERGRC